MIAIPAVAALRASRSSAARIAPGRPNSLVASLHKTCPTLDQPQGRDQPLAGKLELELGFHLLDERQSRFDDLQSLPCPHMIRRIISNPLEVIESSGVVPDLVRVLRRLEVADQRLAVLLAKAAFALGFINPAFTLAGRAIPLQRVSAPQADRP